MIMRIMKVLKAVIIGMEKPHLLVVLRPTATGFMIWLVTSGSGVPIGMARAITADPQCGTQKGRRRVSTVCYVEVLGQTEVTACGWHIVTNTNRQPAIIWAVFVVFQNHSNLNWILFILVVSSEKMWQFRFSLKLRSGARSKKCRSEKASNAPESSSP